MIDLAFLNVGILLGTAAVLIPVLIHLQRRKKGKEVLFPPLKFLMESPLANKRRARIENILLLLLRCLIILLLCLALARPIIKSSLPIRGDLPVDAVFLIDNSYPMGYKQIEGSRLEIAKNKAKDILEGLPPGSQASLLPADGRITQLTSDRQGLKADIETLPISTERVNLPSLLQGAYHILNESRAGEIYIFTDTTKGAWRELNISEKFPSHIGIYIVPCTDGKDENVSLSMLEVSNAAPYSRTTVSFICYVRGGKSRGERTLEWFINGDRKKSQTISLKPDEESSAVFEYTFDKPGFYEGYATIKETDPILVDNYIYFTVHVQERLQVLAMAGPEESLYLESALAPPELKDRNLVNLVFTSDSNLKDSISQKSDFLIIAGTPCPSKESWQLIKMYVSRGGKFFLCAGPQFNIAEYKEEASDILPGVLLEVADVPPAELVLTKEGERFFGEDLLRSPENMSNPTFYKYVKLDFKDKSEKKNILIDFSDGSPALAFKPTGIGKTLFFTSGISKKWGEFPDYPLFLTFFHLLIRTVAGEGKVHRDIKVKEPAALNIYENDMGKPIFLEVPGKDEKIQLAPSSQSLTVAIQDTRNPGVYKVRIDGKVRKTFAANLDGASHISSVNPPETILKSLAPYGRGIITSPKKIERASGVRTMGQELYSYLIYLIMILFVVESFFANK